MVLNQTTKKWLSIIGGVAFVVAQASFMILGIIDANEPEYKVEAVIITEDCLEYVEQNPVQSLPGNHCVRQLKYLKYRIDLVLTEVENVD